ncbi:multidrug resistance protein (plasmid) [Fulvitalea axinellae]|uniref:Multidrug resistance protein n=1 Tax=Fulvitalea axinellae TaxID=1182444 RepID=A0AAU9D2C3_9BACT|nr:multidrug resistance protein [Fulvitalea axinellae]
MRTIIMITVLAVSLFGCGKEYNTGANKRKGAPRKVRTVSAGSLSQVQPVIASGVLASKVEVTVSFKIGGVLQGLYAEEGQTVGAGKRIASLNLSEINAQVKSARQAYDKSVRDLARFCNLYKEKAATLEQKQNAKTAESVAKAQLEVAEFNQRYAKINSPVKGKVLKRFVESGQVVSAGQPIFLIGGSGSKGSQVMRVGLADREVVKLKSGDRAEMFFDAYPSKTFEAFVTEIAEKADPTTGLFEVELSLGKYRPELKSGFIGKVSLYPSKTEEVYVVPMSALVEGEVKTATVFITYDGATVHRKTLRVSEIRGDSFTVPQSELDSGAKIITAGAPYLRDRDSVVIVRHNIISPALPIL